MSRSASGGHGNAWSTGKTGAGGFSAAIRTSGPFVSVFGNSSDGETTLTVQVSQNGTDFYSTSDTITANGDFAKHLTIGAAWVRLKSSADKTVVATIASKG